MAAASYAQNQESAADRYRNLQSAHLTADQSIAAYEKLLHQSPNDAKVQAYLASAFIRKLRETTDFAYLNRASTLVDKILAVDPQSYDGIRLSAEIETHRHNFPKAAQLATVLTDRNPSDSGAFGLLGDCLMELGRYADANDAYQRMLTLSPNLASYNRIAYQRLVTGKTDEALAWMSTAVKAGSPIPENLPWCLVEFGDMLFKTGHTTDAHAAYQMAVKQLPGYHRALAALGREYAAAGEFRKAVDNFKQAQAVIPLPDYAAALEMLYTKLGDRAAAEQQRQLIDVIDKLGKVNGEKGNRALAIVYADENRNLARGVELARAELETRKDVYTQDALSWVLYRAGKQQEAEVFSASALEFHTPEPMFLYHAGIIAIAGGDAERGRELLRQALALNPAFSYAEAQDARRRTDVSKNAGETACATAEGKRSSVGQTVPSASPACGR
jgi:tetratricopeptide (TPR) repeat protein